jgi:hypothetical protein
MEMDFKGYFKINKAKGILDEEVTGKGTVIFDDPLFAIWLRISFKRGKS